MDLLRISNNNKIKKTETETETENDTTDNQYCPIL